MKRPTKIGRIIGTGGDAPRLICIPPAGSGASFYRQLAQRISPAVQVEVLELPGRGSRFAEPLCQDLDGLTDALAQHVVLTQPPYGGRCTALFGHSFGAILALELARALARLAHTPDVCFLSACVAPQHIARLPRLHDKPDEDLLRALRALGGTHEELLDDDEFISLLLPIFRADLELFETYARPALPLLDCDAVVMFGRDDPTVTASRVSGWMECFGGVTTWQQYKGGHFYLHDQLDLVVEDIKGRLIA